MGPTGRRAGLVCPLCRGRCRGPGSAASHSSLSFSGCCSISRVRWRRHLAHPKTRLWSSTLYTLGSLTVILLPGAISYGILRHRLIDLDLVVRKSVAYGAAFLLIAATYAVTQPTRLCWQSGARNPGRHRRHRCRARLPAAPPATRICRQQKAVRRSRTAVPATEEPRHDDGADSRTRRAAAATRKRHPRRNRCELGTGPTARRGW